MPGEFHKEIVRAIKSIPPGRVATYGQIAALAGNPRGARQVSWVLNASSEKEKLPWFRVINSKGEISLPSGDGCELQKALLEGEGVEFNRHGQIDLARFQWQPGRK